jgi:hypothetical protein
LVLLFSAVIVVPLGITFDPPDDVGSVMVQPTKKEDVSDEVNSTVEVAVLFELAAIDPGAL